MMDQLLQSFLEVQLPDAQGFLKIKETLTRIGIASDKQKRLFQTCHILHKRGKYYIVHFKELFMLDGRPSSLDQDDIARRNLIANLLHEWELLTLVDERKSEEPEAEITSIRIIPHKEKSEWQLVPKYQIGQTKK